MLGYLHKGKPMALGNEIATEALKSVPPIGLAAFTLNDALIVAGIVWIAIQAFVFIHKYIVWIRAGKPVIRIKKKSDENSA